MNMFGYLTVYFEAIFENETEARRYGMWEIDFLKPITQDVFDLFDKSLREIYSMKEKLKVKEIRSITKEEYLEKTTEHYDHGTHIQFHEDTISVKDY